uniref:SPK domain-containing protein n=1 Tax=Caenorhabditis tropicalis TaxID=1561998 RepID=A0A1I7U168_9PELO
MKVAPMEEEMIDLRRKIHIVSLKCDIHSLKMIAMMRFLLNFEKTKNQKFTVNYSQMNAEAFLKTRNEHANLVELVIEKMNETVSEELKEKIASIRRKGAYYSVRGERSFVRYTKNLSELNNALRCILATFQTTN